jgi:hypothetical protein
MPPHDFDRSLAHGAAAEARVVEHLTRAHGWSCVEAPRADQWHGIDLVARTPDGRSLKVEVKADSVAHRSRRAFIETMSNDRTGRKGWVHTCVADWLLYLVEPLTLYWFLPEVLRAHLPEWERLADLGRGRWGRRSADNGTYHTLGIVVPLHVFSLHAERAEALQP